LQQYAGRTGADHSEPPDWGDGPTGKGPYRGVKGPGKGLIGSEKPYRLA